MEQQKSNVEIEKEKIKLQEAALKQAERHNDIMAKILEKLLQQDKGS